MYSARDTCLFMLGAFGASGKTPEAYIGAGPYPQQHLNMLNEQAAQRSKRAPCQWSMCVVICVPTARRLDVTALKIFWQIRSRKLANRVKFGVKLAMALQLTCWVEPRYLDEMLALPHKQRVVDSNTLVGPPLCRQNETICFTIGSATANEFTRKAEHRSILDVPELDDAPDVDWEKLARLAIDDPGAPLDVVSQTIQANTIELMLHAADPAQRSAASVVLDNAKQIAHGPLARADVGVRPLEHLREAIDTTCRGADGVLDNRLLFTHGDECYNDINEYRERPLERVRLHRGKYCVCGNQRSLVQRVRVRSIDRVRMAYRCSTCKRLTVASIVLQPSINALRSRAGAPPAADAAATALKCYRESFELPVATIDDTPSVPTTPSRSETSASADRLLPLKRKSNK